MWTFVAFVCALGTTECIQTGPQRVFATEQQCEDFAMENMPKLKGATAQYRCLNWDNLT